MKMKGGWGKNSFGVWTEEKKQVNCLTGRKQE